MTEFEIMNSAEFYRQSFNGISMSNGELASKVFEECDFVRCSFNGALLDRCKFIDCTFRSCDLSNLRIAWSKFQATQFEECKVIGVDWTKGDWPRFATSGRLSFRKSILNDSSFFGLKLPELVLQECKVHSVDFRGGDFSHSDFTYSDFLDSMFGGTDLRGANFTEAMNYDINVLNNQLKGATFTRMEATRLLNGLGIKLED